VRTTSILWADQNDNFENKDGSERSRTVVVLNGE
jgi:hypothetical protein